MYAVSVTTITNFLLLCQAVMPCRLLLTNHMQACHKHALYVAQSS